MYIDTQFELLTRTLEVYHRRIHGGFMNARGELSKPFAPLTDFIQNGAGLRIKKFSFA